MDASERLKHLADASRYDLSCACGTQKDEHRRRGRDGLWLYPTSLPSGGTSIMLKTLLSSACANDCRYCPLRRERDTRRYTLTPDEVAAVFMDYVRRENVFGLFLTSGVLRDPDFTMDRLVAVARLLRGRHEYRGYIHLKVIPGASDAAIEEALRLASAVSLNVEAPKRSAFEALSTSKDFDRDIVRPMKLISRLTARGSRYARVKQTTQFIVGASTETDSDIVQATWGLYRRLHLDRVYYSAYQRGLGDPSIPGEQAGAAPPEDLLTREHRLYQVDWLIRKYGFQADEIPLESDGNLSLAADPKQVWAQRHPDRFPVDVNRADKFELLRVPGLGPVSVKRILEIRARGSRVRSVADLGRPSQRLRAAEGYLKFGSAPLIRTVSSRAPSSGSRFALGWDRSGFRHAAHGNMTSIEGPMLLCEARAWEARRGHLNPPARRKTMTTEERLGNLERELAPAKHCKRWLIVLGILFVGVAALLFVGLNLWHPETLRGSTMERLVRLLESDATKCVFFIALGAGVLCILLGIPFNFQLLAIGILLLGVAAAAAGRAFATVYTLSPRTESFFEKEQGVDAVTMLGLVVAVTGLSGFLCVVFGLVRLLARKKGT